MAATIKVEVIVATVTASLVSLVEEGPTLNESIDAATELQPATEESGDDQSTTITLVTPMKDYVCPAPSKFLRPVQEASTYASAEVVC